MTRQGKGEELKKRGFAPLKHPIFWFEILERFPSIFLAARIGSIPNFCLRKTSGC
jgi:hypothetical protein